MFGINGFRSSTGLLFGFMDSLLILTGLFLGTKIRFWGVMDVSYRIDHLILKMMLMVLVIQLDFYYFDLYDSKTFKERKKMGLLLLGSLGASSILLAVIYYLIPFLTVGRGIFAISLFLILILTFSWRVVYSYILRSWAPKEKILIVGTGKLAKKIKSEILDNGYEGFEIVGFIDENRDKIGRRV
jgi:FlaA1/EpsC-like NDP-sugar epimerase